MTLIDLQQKLKDRIRTAARELFGVELQQINSETPPRPELGDLAFPVSFELAKLVKQATGEKQNPRAMAEKLKPQLEDVEEVSRVEIAGAGYINVFFDRARLLSLFAGPARTAAKQLDQPKKMVEHTSINPNKAAHIGHVRNAVLGDTFVRFDGPEEFRDWSEPGFCKVVARHEVVARGAGSEIRSDVRIWCTNRRALLRFRPYWAFIGPFSRFIGPELLAAAVRRAERTSAATA